MNKNKTQTIVYLLLSYKQEAFIGEAVRAALAQEGPPMTVVISDDRSPDATFTIIEDTVAGYTGPHRIRLNRNPVRMGSVDHLAAITQTIGDAFIVMAHGDDVARPDRTRRLVETWRAQRVSMVSSGAEWIGSTGSRDDGSRRSRRIEAQEMLDSEWMPEMLGAALAFDSRVLSAFDKLTGDTLACGLDHVLPLRAALLDGFYYVSDKLIGYRRHAGNMSNLISDRSSGEEVHNEGLTAYELAMRGVQCRDVLAAQKMRRFDWRRRKLLRTLERKIVRELGYWSEQRARLAKQGLVATWRPALELRARAATIEISF